MWTYFNGFLSYNYNQIIKNHLLDIENLLTYIRSAHAQFRARKLRLPSYVKLHFYGLRWAWKVKNWDIHINFSRLIMMKNGNLLYIYGTIHFLHNEICTNALVCAPKPGKYELSYKKYIFPTILR